MNYMNGYNYCNPYTSWCTNSYAPHYASVMSYPMIQQANSFSIESDYEALCGQEHRSSADFTATGNYSISAQPGVDFNIKINRSLQIDDPVLGNIRYKNGSTIFFSGEKYYISDPRGATNPFQVKFSLIIPPRPGSH